MKKAILVAFVSIFLLSATALAEYRNTSYPGLMCRYYGKIGNDTYFNPNGYSANGIKNTSSSDYYMACPIANPTHDSELSDSGNSYLNWGRITIDTTSGDCKLYGRSLTGSSNYYFSTTVIEAQNNGLQRHVMNPSTFIATYGDSLSIFCKIPGGKYINNYDAQFYWY
jgi:hypothetical protein